MKFSLAVLALAAAVHAQTRDDIPSCALPCIDDAVSSQSSCKTTDIPCICQNFDAIRNAATSCIIDKCGADAALNQVLPATQALCSAGSSAGSAASSAIAASTSSAAALSSSAAAATSSAAAVVSSAQSVASSIANSVSSSVASSIGSVTSSVGSVVSSARSVASSAGSVASSRASAASTSATAAATTTAPATGGAAVVGSVGGLALLALGALAL